MKGQISRHSDDRDKRYSGLLQIQGAMITDADLNESTPGHGSRYRPRWR